MSQGSHAPCGAVMDLTSDGYRRLQPDELAKGIGLPSTWVGTTPFFQIKDFVVDWLTSVHLWEAIGHVLYARLPVI